MLSMQSLLQNAKTHLLHYCVIYNFIIWNSLPWQSSDGMQDFFQKEYWKHHPKPHADFMEMKQKEDQELAASRKKLIPGLA